MMPTRNIDTLQKIERTAKSPSLYRKVFDQIVDPEKVSTILDVGAGDSPFAQEASQCGQSVTRVDFDYASSPPDGDNWASADATDLGEFRGQYQVAISSFMMQHLSQEDQSKAMQEMIDATVVHTPDGNGYQGIVGIYPVYKGNKLRELIDESGFSDVAFVRDTGANSDVMLAIDENHLSSYSTLYILNDESLNEDRKRRLTDLIANSNALNRRKTISDRVRRAFMKPGVSKVR